MPYPDSLWNKQLPADVMSHLLPNSDSIAQAVISVDGTNSYPWTRQNTYTFGVSSSDPGAGFPLFYGHSTDPAYQIADCLYPSSGIHDPTVPGRLLHVPQGADFSSRGPLTGGADKHFALWDQSTNTIFSSYDSSAQPPRFTCPDAFGNDGSQDHPCRVGGFEYCAISNWDSDPGWGIGGDDSLGDGGFATHVRAAEIMSGHIPHAIYLSVDCAAANPDGSPSMVFPATGQAGACPQGANRPPLGAHFFLDYTQDQLDELFAQLPLWQYAILEALTKYGGYFGDTILNDRTGYPGPGFWGYEGSQPYTLAGMKDPLYNWLNTNPAFESTDDRTDGLDPSQPLTCYSIVWQGVNYTECDMAPWVGIPKLPGPTCHDPDGCDVSMHMHIADPCIALGLAGQPGGCVAPF
jgi:hypothetical protein